jgi:hypothetical protein
MSDTYIHCILSHCSLQCSCMLLHIVATFHSNCVGIVHFSCYNEWCILLKHEHPSLYPTVQYSPVCKRTRCQIMCLELCVRQRTWRPALHSTPNWTKTKMIWRQVLFPKSIINCSVTNWKAVECTVFLLPNAFPCPICWRDIQCYLGGQRVRSVCILSVCTRSLFLSDFMGNCFFSLHI